MYLAIAGGEGFLFGSNDNQGYVFAYDGDGSESLLEQYRYMQDKNGQRQDDSEKDVFPDDPGIEADPDCTDISPSESTCEDHKKWDQCNESWMKVILKIANLSVDKCILMK